VTTPIIRKRSRKPSKPFVTDRQESSLPRKGEVMKREVRKFREKRDRKTGEKPPTKNECQKVLNI